MRIELNDSGHERLKTISHSELAASIRKSFGGKLGSRYKIEFAAPRDDSVDFIAGNEWPQLLSIRATGTSAELNIWVQKDLVWFQGHFPEHPVLAGVVQTHWACEIARHLFGFSANFKAIENLKFQRIIKPQTQLLLSLEYSTDKQRLVFRYGSRHGDYSKGRVLFSQ